MNIVILGAGIKGSYLAKILSQEKHNVETVTPVNEKSELEVHEDMDRQGGQVKEIMQATREHNEKKKKEKEKQRLESSLRKKIVKERVEKLKARDKKSGLLDVAEKTRKRGKKS